MVKTIVTVTGMACPKCEARVNDAINKNFQVSGVTSSHEENKTTILSEASLDQEAIKDVITKTGYTVGEICVTE